MEKFVTPEPLPTPYENELLDILIEECAEVIQRATKMKRFGVKEVQPGQDLTNAERLSMEVGDLICLLDMCEDVELIDPFVINRQYAIKEEKLKVYMQHSKED